MGGIRTNKDGAVYGMKGLFSNGESACWDMHGFNRLGGNSLAETIVSGHVVGKKVVEFLQGYETKFAELKVQDRINTLIHGTGDDCYTLRNAMQDIMMEDVGIFRNGKDLQDGVNRLQELLERSKNMRLMGNITKGANAELAQALRIPGEIRLALCTAYGALQRTESRGAHTQGLACAYPGLLARRSDSARAQVRARHHKVHSSPRGPRLRRRQDYTR